MNETTAVIPANTLELTATTPAEMREAQDKLIAWCEAKIAQVKHDAAELAENLAIAIKNKWRTATLRKHAALATKRVTFYEKIKAALDAGYCIVPSFPIALFAIRTDRDTPKPKTYIGTYLHSGDFTQEAKLLPVGEGEYKNPVPKVLMDTKQITVRDPSNQLVQKTQYTKWAHDFDPEIDFPLNMAKPEIMTGTEKAMAKKIFDEIGVLPDPKPKKDPMILGTIIDPNKPPYGPPRRIMFVIAWHLNVRDL